MSDCCPMSTAKWVFVRDIQSLEMCGHHAERHDSKLTAEGWVRVPLIDSVPVAAISEAPAAPQVEFSDSARSGYFWSLGDGRVGLLLYNITTGGVWTYHVPGGQGQAASALEQWKFSGMFPSGPGVDLVDGEPA